LGSLQFNRGISTAIVGLAVLCLIPITVGFVDKPLTTELIDEQDIVCPSRIPNSPFSWILEPEYYPIQVRRKIVFYWSERDSQRNRTVTIPLGLPEEGSVDMSSDVMISRRLDVTTPLLTFQARNGISWVNLTYRLPLEKYVATFGRVQLSWNHERPRGLPKDINVSAVTRVTIPDPAVIDFAAPYPDIVGEGFVIFRGYREGFLYFEGSGARIAAFFMLGIFASAVVLFLATGPRRFLLKVERRVSGRIRQRGRQLISRLPSRRLVATLMILAALALGASLVMGPLPRLNVVVFTNPVMPFSLSGFSDEHPEIFFVPMRYKTFHLMDRFDMIDVVMVDHWILPPEDERLAQTLEMVGNKGAVALLRSDYADRNRAYFSSFKVYEYSTAAEAEKVLLDLADAKRRQSRFGLGYGYFRALAPVLAILSLVLVAVAAFLSSYLVLTRSEGSLLLDASVACAIFLAMFVLLLVCYLAAGHLVHMPLGWHGPSGKGLTIVSLLSAQIGGGNWPRAFSAAVGILISLALLVTVRRVKVSPWPAVIFTIMLYLSLQANPTISPIYARMVSGENDYTPPRDYLSRKGVDTATQWMYRIHYGEALLYGTALGENKVLSMYSRGIAFGLAAGSMFCLLGRISPILGSLLGPSLLLITSRFFTRVGDLSLRKTMWVFPTGLVAGILLALCVFYLDRFLRKARYFAFLAKPKLLGVPLIPFLLALTSFGVLWRSIVLYDLGLLAIGLAISALAVSSVESYRLLRGKEG